MILVRRHFNLLISSQRSSKTEGEGERVGNDAGSTSPTSSAAANTMAKSHRMLIVDYTPGSSKQAWGLVSKGGTYMDGEGDPKEIAASICTIVTERGASFVK